MPTFTRSDEQWQKILPFLRSHPSAYVGREQDCRQFLEAVQGDIGSLRCLGGGACRGMKLFSLMNPFRFCSIYCLWSLGRIPVFLGSPGMPLMVRQKPGSGSCDRTLKAAA